MPSRKSSEKRETKFNWDQPGCLKNTILESLVDVIDERVETEALVLQNDLAQLVVDLQIFDTE